MDERRIPRREAVGLSPSGFDDLGSDGNDEGAMVTVYHGVHAESLPVGNMTVREIRRRYADRFDIDPRARAELDGSYVADNTLVRAGQMLVFANHAGEKGRLPAIGSAAGNR